MSSIYHSSDAPFSWRKNHCRTCLRSTLHAFQRSNTRLLTLKRNGMFCLERFLAHTLVDLWIWLKAYPSYSRTKSEMSQRRKFSLQHQRAYKNYTRRPTNLYVVSTFGICVGLLRERGVKMFAIFF